MVNRWRKEYKKYPDTAFKGRGNLYKEDARIAESERLVGRLYAENEFLKKSFEHFGKARPGGNGKIPAGVKFMTIQQNIEPEDPLSIQHITRLMNVSRCGYYK